MKRVIFLIAASLISVALSAQTWGYNTVEIRIKEGNENEIIEAYDKVHEDVKLTNGNVGFQKINKGSDNEMTHRMIWAWELGTEWFSGLDDNKAEAFWAKMGNYVEEWGESYSGRFLSWKGGSENDDDHKIRHVWNIKPKNPKQFKLGHDNLVKRFKKEFEGRIVSLGTYDFNGPNGATHWVVVSGKSVEDHMMLYDELQKQDDFYTLISERGEVERVGDVEYEMIKSFRMEEN
tara:strand:+ start:130 stop:831 length:702 start_codon:yes stop_codon:yes gene_type:complete